MSTHWCSTNQLRWISPLHLKNGNLTSKTTRKLKIPHDASNYRHTLHIQMHYETIPANLKILDNAYVIINRGWNNMYHHSEWIIQFLRYMMLSDIFPPVGFSVSTFYVIDEYSHSIS